MHLPSDISSGDIYNGTNDNFAHGGFFELHHGYAVEGGRRHRRFSADGTWDRIHAEILADADAAGRIDWAVSVDSTVNRAHQHATNFTRNTGGGIELHESVRRAG